MADEMTGADVQNAAGTQNVKRGWFVLRAISGKEAKVKEILDAAIRNTDLGRYVFQVLIPTEPVYQTRNARRCSSSALSIAGMFLWNAVW